MKPLHAILLLQNGLFLYLEWHCLCYYHAMNFPMGAITLSFLCCCSLNGFVLLTRFLDVRRKYVGPLPQRIYNTKAILTYFKNINVWEE